MAPHWTYWFVFSHKRVDRGFQIGQICRVTCRWILPAPAVTMSRHPQDSTWASPSLPGPAWPSLRQLRGRHHRAAAQRSREVQEGWKNWFCAKFICCCNRSAQEKYQVFVSVPVWISLEKLKWNLWKLKWEKWVWTDTLTWAQNKSSGLFCWNAATDTEIWCCETIVRIDNLQGIFMGNRINGHASTSHGQLICKSACWLNFSQITPECLPCPGWLTQAWPISPCLVVGAYQATPHVGYYSNLWKTPCCPVALSLLFSGAWVILPSLAEPSVLQRTKHFFV